MAIDLCQKERSQNLTPKSGQTPSKQHLNPASTFLAQKRAKIFFRPKCDYTCRGSFSLAPFWAKNVLAGFTTVLYPGLGQNAQRFADQTKLRIGFPNLVVADLHRGSWATQPLEKAFEFAGPNEPVVLIGFSAGGMYVHKIAHIYPNLLGMWIYSSPPPKRFIPTKDVPVVLSCNNSETNKLPRFGLPWYSMKDYREQAIKYYPNALVLTGEGKHRWDPDLNQEAIKWFDLS